MAIFRGILIAVGQLLATAVGLSFLATWAYLAHWVDAGIVMLGALLFPSFQGVLFICWATKHKDKFAPWSVTKVVLLLAGVLVTSFLAYLTYFAVVFLPFSLHGVSFDELMSGTRRSR